jgi:drug/metabolite transporter (DMT)-like permease
LEERLIYKSLGVILVMQVEFLALAASALFGLNAIFLKRGYLHSSPLASNIVMTSINVIAFWSVSLLFVPLGTFLTKGVIFFAVGGLLGQALARTLQYTGIDKIGPPRNHTVLSTMSLFTAIFAMLILGEKPGLNVLFGTLLIMAGVSLVMWEHRNSVLHRKYLLFPLIAAAIYGIVNIIQKIGLTITQSAIAGATIATTSALFGLLVFSGFTGKIAQLSKLGKAKPYFIAAGCINSIGFLLNYYVLQKVDVTVAAPLIGTQPIFATLFTYLFLKEDRITWNVVLGAISAVAGVVAITAF